MSAVISIENVCKSYRLGTIGSGTLREDLQSWWHRVRGRPDPNRRLDRTHLPVEGHTLWALQDVSLSVEQGEVLGIIGRNGAGKSTLLKILSRVTAPTSGRIRVKGRVASLLEVGTGFHPELTGRENVFLNGAILGMTKAEVARKFDEIVAFSEIEDFIDTPVKRYSSGMYVRLAFAVAAHLDPEILVVDEVLAVGDAGFQKRCLGKMGDVAKSGRTVLFVSHNMPSILTLCTQAVWMGNGRTQRAGEPDEVVKAYLSSVSAAVEERSGIAQAEHRGTGQVRIVQVEARTDGQRSAPGLTTGRDSTLRFAYEARQTPVKVHLVVIVANARGEPCLHLNSDKVGQLMRLDAARGAILLHLPRCPLVRGTYGLDVKVCDSAGVVLDHVPQGESIVVNDGDFYGNGRPPVPGTGSVLADHAFEVAAD